MAAVAALVAAALTAASAQNSPFYARLTYLDCRHHFRRRKASTSSENSRPDRRENGNIDSPHCRRSAAPIGLRSWKAARARAAYAVAHGKGAVTREFQAALNDPQTAPTNPHTLLPFANARTPRVIPAGGVYMVEHVDFRVADPSVAEGAVAFVKALAERDQKNRAHCAMTSTGGRRRASTTTSHCRMDRCQGVSTR